MEIFIVDDGSKLNGQNKLNKEFRPRSVKGDSYLNGVDLVVIDEKISLDKLPPIRNYRHFDDIIVVGEGYSLTDKSVAVNQTENKKK